MASGTLITFFTLQSPWSYLGHGLLGDIARRHEAKIIYKPINLGRLFSESGGLPLAKRHPKRQAYRDIELQRWRDKRGIPLNIRPAFWPLDIASADRIVVALVESGIDPDPFIRRAFAGIWADELNLADESTLARLLDDGRQDSAAILALAKTSGIGERYAANTDEALNAGVFGAPTTILDGEPFWGQDRLELLDEAFSSGRSPLKV